MTDLIAQVQDRNSADHSTSAEMEKKLFDLQFQLREAEAEKQLQQRAAEADQQLQRQKEAAAEAEIKRLKTALRKKEEEAEELKTTSVVGRVCV